MRASSKRESNVATLLFINAIPNFRTLGAFIRPTACIRKIGISSVSICGGSGSSGVTSEAVVRRWPRSLGDDLVSGFGDNASEASVQIHGRTASLLKAAMQVAQQSSGSNGELACAGADRTSCAAPVQPMCRAWTEPARKTRRSGRWSTVPSYA